MTISFIPPHQSNKIINETEITYTIEHEQDTLDIAFIKSDKEEPAHLEIAFSEQEKITYSRDEIFLLRKLSNSPNFAIIASTLHELLNSPEVQSELNKIQ